MNAKAIDDIIAVVVQREGSAFTNDPKDSGGPTKYGITLATLSKHRKHPVTAQDVAALTEAEAHAIYRNRFVVEPGYLALLNVSEIVAEEVIDTGVNLGPPRATMLLQQALNALNRNGRDYSDVAEDGECGQSTVAALLSYLTKRGREGELILHRALNCLQGAFYIDLARRRPKDEEYLYGWLRTRVSLGSVK